MKITFRGGRKFVLERGEANRKTTSFWCKLSDKIQGLSNVLHTSEQRCLLAGFCFCCSLHKVRQGVKLWKCCVPHSVGAWRLWICSTCKNLCYKFISCKPQTNTKTRHSLLFWNHWNSVRRNIKFCYQFNLPIIEWHFAVNLFVFCHV